MSETVYIETSILGYLTARPTTNPVLVGKIEVTREWWEKRRSRSNCPRTRLFANMELQTYCQCPNSTEVSPDKP
jgi:hypothetical protein